MMSLTYAHRDDNDWKFVIGLRLQPENAFSPPPKNQNPQFREKKML